MDPNRTLAQLLLIAYRVRAAEDLGEEPEANAAGEMADGIAALNDWLERGGELPAAWERTP